MQYTSSFMPCSIPNHTTDDYGCLDCFVKIVGENTWKMIIEKYGDEDWSEET